MSSTMTLNHITLMDSLKYLNNFIDILFTTTVTSDGLHVCKLVGQKPNTSLHHIHNDTFHIYIKIEEVEYMHLIHM